MLVFYQTTDYVVDFVAPVITKLTDSSNAQIMDII